MSGRRRPPRVLRDPASPVRPFRAVARAAGETPQDDIAALHGQARREGFERGWREAQEAFEAQVAEFRRQMAESLERMGALLETMIGECQERLLALAVDVGARIARARIEAGDPVAARALEEALALLPRDCAARVRVHPEDVPALREQFATAVAEGRVELVEDPAISRGGCRVESEAGTLDATWETAVELAREAVLQGGERR